MRLINTRAILGESAPITDAVGDRTQWWRLAGFPCREEMGIHMAADWRRYYANKLAEFTINSLD